MSLRLWGALFCLALLVPSCSSYYSTKHTTALPSQPPIVEEENARAVESEELKEVEKYFGAGVDANREARWLDAQDNFEKALEILGNLDVDEEQESEYTKKVNSLLREIAQEYKLTLVSLGTLDTESSISAFLERYSDIENFRPLGKSTAQVVLAQPNTIIYDMPIEWNERVENCIVYFQTVGRGPFVNYLRRSGKYVDLMKKIMVEKDLPTDLAYLPMIESGYNPRAYSWARAVGPWQFISSTGKLYDLKRSWWYDERRDFVKSTYAAAGYLKFLHKRFGCWNLALAAYNCGEGNIDRAIKKYRTKDFWQLGLKRQTADYVPLYMAATIIAKDPSKYGFGDVELEEPIQYDEVQVNDCVDLRSVAEVLDVPVQIIRDLNPEILRDVTPPNLKRYTLRVPTGMRAGFEDVFSRLSEDDKITWIRHEIKRGETVSSIAKDYKISPFAIIDANKLGRNHKIVAGEYLKIPASYKQKTLKGHIDGEKRIGAKPGHVSSDDLFVYTVRKGDTLDKIAKTFQTTAVELARINNLKDKSYIVKGQRLKVPVDESKYDFQPKKNKDNMIVHVVGAGETLWGIAVDYGVSLEKLLRWNRLDNPALIRVGDKIRVYQ